MKKFKVGIQLFTLRDAMSEDMDATLKAVKEMGYDYVEFADYYGKSAEEIKAILDKYDLEAVSVHQIIEIFEEKGKASVDFLKELGATYCAIPWFKKEEYFGNWDVSIQRLKNAVKMMLDGGIVPMYHNHGFEFQKIDGKFILDKIYSEIPELRPQLDTCWVHYSGVNPVEYIKKYSGRMDVLHLKDFVCEKLTGCGPLYKIIAEKSDELATVNKNEATGFKLVPVGSGVQDFPAILEAAEEAGIEYVIVEQDSFSGMTPMEAAKMSRDYLKSLGL